MQENLVKFDKRYLVVGIGINLVKNPEIKNYETTNLYELVNKRILKNEIVNNLKKIFELKLTQLFR